MTAPVPPTPPTGSAPGPDDWPEAPGHPLAARPAILDRLPVARDIDTPTMLGRLRMAVWVLAALGAFTWVVLGANRPADPQLVDEFGTIAINVVSPAGSRLPSAACAELAATDSARQRGLTGRVDLGGHVGMVFVFQQDSTNPFHMRGVPIDLSIAWFDATGAFVSSADMAACVDQSFCPTYPPAGTYRFALEVRGGDLGALGIGPGARLELGEEGCRPSA